MYVAQVDCEHTMSSIRPLSAELAKKAAEELNEDPQRLAEDLETIKQWLAKTPHIRPCLDDQFLVSFLRGCAYKLEVVKQKLDLFYTVRSALPIVNTNRDPTLANTRAIIKAGVYVHLPLEKPDGPRILLLRPGACDAKKYSLEEMMKVGVLLQEMLQMEDDNFVVGGQQVIFDMAGITMAHVSQATPAVYKKASMLVLESCYRTHSMATVNLPSTFNYLFNIASSFLDADIKSNYRSLNSIDELFKFVPKALFPTEYGGDAGNLAELIETMDKKFLSYRDYFIRSEKWGVDENRRPGRPKNAQSLFGVDGTFRTLNID